MEGFPGRWLAGLVSMRKPHDDDDDDDDDDYDDGNDNDMSLSNSLHSSFPI